jgi:hypothetical protein
MKPTLKHMTHQSSFFINCTLLTVLISTFTLVTEAQKRKTEVAITGEDFYINGEITLKGKTFNGMRLEGLLPNSRMVQGIFDDYNPGTQSFWQYPDTKIWDPERNTNEFVAAMADWRRHGLLAFTLNLQGGSPFGYSAKKQNWLNSAFKHDGTLDEKYLSRLTRILNRADELGMVVILGYFYFGQDQNVRDEDAVKNAVRLATQWVLDNGFRNVIIEINNECDINTIAKNNTVDPYDHPILDSKRVHELINLAKSIERNGRRLLVSTSFIGGAVPTDSVLKVADFVLIHGNGVPKADQLANLVKIVRARSAYSSNPIVINEDDHFDFEKPHNHFIAATSEHASWGYFDYRMKDEKFEDGYQSVPVDWSIRSERKRAFFQLVKRMTGQ